jgi:hypothetical protein
MRSLSTDFEAPVRVFKDTARKKDNMSDVDLDHQEGASPTCHFIYPVGLSMMQAHPYTIFAMASSQNPVCASNTNVPFFIEAILSIDCNGGR